MRVVNGQGARMSVYARHRALDCAMSASIPTGHIRPCLADEGRNGDGNAIEPGQRRAV